ncbi:MAG TPA: alpha-amylase family glycosyl hydrolase, partial [Polyangiaceae bacterium]|nr:alpha-amylase family glycosyl hydrolase [Polyangiaceae bacterium]
RGRGFAMKPVIYQLVIRYFGNAGGSNRIDGGLRENGCGKFEDINGRALAELARFGVTHVWLTGVHRQATLTDYSSTGLPADPPEVVNGRAGSFYSVRDYAEVCPDYAVNPARRMEEFSALVKRIHAPGLRVLIDLVPNHLSRNYSSDGSSFAFGRFDDQSKFFDAQNNFYYLVDPYDREMSSVSDALRPHLLQYLENHDERRIASPVVSGTGAGESGFGSSAAGYQLAPLHLLYGSGPLLVFNGQEVGEPGAGATGFKGDNGRTTIFDYWRMPVFARWVNGHAYDGGQLDTRELSLRRFYADLLSLCQHPSVAGSSYWGLRYCNQPGAAGGSSGWLHPYARFAPGARRALVVVTNFRPRAAESGQVHVPRELTRICGIPDATSVQVRLILNERGKQSGESLRLPVEELATRGFSASVSEQACNVYELVA